MTAADFLSFYPQFSEVIPPAVLDAYVGAANLRFTDFDDDAEEARRLYIAHKLTLYAKTMPASSSSGSSAASSYASLSSAGDGSKITSKKVDGVSVTYASGTSSSSGSSSKLSDLEETIFGLQLLTLLRIHACTRYIP